MKINFFVRFELFLIFFMVVPFNLFSTDTPEEREISEDSEIPQDYVFEFVREDDGSVYTAPENEGNGSGDNKDHETQGIAAIGEDYWILAKNKYIDTFVFNKYNYFSDEEDKVDNFNPESKAGDIDFSDGFLYVPDDKLRIYEWFENHQSSKYQQVAALDWDYDLPYATVFPYRKIVFTDFDSGNAVFEGVEVKENDEKWEKGSCSLKIKFKDKEGNIHNPCSAGDSYCTQGADFSPNGRFIFYVRDFSVATYVEAFLEALNGGGVFNPNDVNVDPTGIYVYYIPDEDFIKLKNNICPENIKAVNVGFENILFNPIASIIDVFGDIKVIRDKELEGIEISSLGKYDIHQLMLNNTSGSNESHTIYHWMSGDYDEDNIKDINDNCPFVKNYNQKDWNKDGIGDACQDSDEDGIMDEDDNCLETYNSDQNNWNGGVGDACQDSSGDGWMDDMSACPNLDMRKYFPDMVYVLNNQAVDITTKSCRRSTDLMCVNIRAVSDYCDMDGDGRWDLEPEDEYEIDEYAYSASGLWSKLGENVNIENCKGISCFGTQEIGHKLSVTQRASYFCGQNDTKSKLSTYFCYCGKNDDEHLQCKDNGNCGKDHANPNKVWDEKVILSPNGQSTWQPVFSEFQGINTNSEGCWKSGGKFDKIKKLSKIKEWDYKTDKYLKKLLTGDDFLVHKDGESVRQNGNYTMLKLAQGVVTGSSSSYVTTTASGGHNLNKNYFSNYNQTHVLGNKAELILAKQNSEYVDIIIEEVPYLRIRVNPELGGYGKWWYDMMRDYIGIKPWDDPRWEQGFEDRVKHSIYESISRPSEFSKVGFDGNSINLESVSFKDDYNQIFSFGGRDAAYFMKDGVFSIAFTDVNGIFNDVSPVAYGIEMRSAAALTSGTEIFMVAGFKERTARTSSEHADINSAEQMPERSASFAKISFSDNGAYMTTLSPLPWEPVHISLFEVEGRIHSIMMDGNGTGEILVYYSENEYWEKLSDFNFGKVFSLNNTFVKGNELYFTAPGPNDQNTLYSWSSEFGINEVASLGISYDAFIKPLNSGEKIILADLKDISGNIGAWELSEGEFTPVSIQIEKPEYETAFCISEINGSIFPGATNYKGQCISVYDYNYQTVSYLDYKKTVAGHKNNLYIGGLTGVRRVEINEDGSLSNSDMLYTGETNNLAVYGNTMYGANYGEIDIYAIAENGSISRVKGISSSSCGNVRVSGDMLFTAENKKVRVFDLTDPQNPTLVKTITTAGKVIDLEVIGERLYIYEETTSWLTTKGFTGIYDISNLNSPVKTKYFEKRCTDAEMQRSGETIYLGCKNGQYRIEETGLKGITGEKNFVREGYVHNKVLYQVYSGALHKSKVSGIQAECGNGMIEPGEICDSDTIQCTELDSSYIGGTASCNSACDGYNESVCETDGW